MNCPHPIRRNNRMKSGVRKRVKAREKAPASSRVITT
jgi:hypothetical protein